MHTFIPPAKSIVNALKKILVLSPGEYWVFAFVHATMVLFMFMFGALYVRNYLRKAKAGEEGKGK